MALSLRGQLNWTVLCIEICSQVGDECCVLDVWIVRKVLITL
jgi:hypothetical protein